MLAATDDLVNDRRSLRFDFTKAPFNFVPFIIGFDIMLGISVFLDKYVVRSHSEVPRFKLAVRVYSFALRLEVPQQHPWNDVLPLWILGCRDSVH